MLNIAWYNVETVHVVDKAKMLNANILRLGIDKRKFML